jgi:hypothetical protein
VADDTDAMEDGLSEDQADDLEELRERIERLRESLRDPARTDFRIVMVPEEMSVLESERLRDRLDAFGIPVGMVVVNRVMEDLADVTGSAVETGASDAFVSLGGPAGRPVLGPGAVPGPRRRPRAAVRRRGPRRGAPPGRRCLPGGVIYPASFTARR